MVQPIDATADVTGSCVRQLERAILEGERQAGTRLPPERELAGELGVNRITLRSALAQLKASRLLSVRHGSGYLVRDFWRSGGVELNGKLLEMPSRHLRAPIIVSDLLRVRRALARVLLERLAESSAAQHLDDVTEAVDRFAEAVERRRPPEELAAIDLDIVAALAAATGSEVLRLCVNPVAGLLGQLPRLQRAIYREPERNLDAFRALSSWLERGAPQDVIEPVIATMAAIDAATTRAFEQEMTP